MCYEKVRDLQVNHVPIPLPVGTRQCPDPALSTGRLWFRKSRNPVSDRRTDEQIGGNLLRLPYLCSLVLLSHLLLLGCSVPTTASAPSPTTPTAIASPTISATDTADPAASDPATADPVDTLFSSMPMRGQVLPITAELTINSQVIQLEVARTVQQQSIGLMYRPQLPDNRGMLFPFQPAQTVSFWMRNTLISLDMVFLRQGKVQAIAANVPPCKTAACPTYGPGVPVDQVIELRGGRAAELGLRVGDTLKVKYLP